LTRFLLAILLATFALTTKAQEHRFGSWNELAITHDLNKKWKVGGDVMARLYPCGYNSQYIAEAGLSRELGKRFEAGAGYRFTLKDEGHEQRVQFDLSYAYRKKGFQLSDRVRYQYEWDYTLHTANYLRNKTTLKYSKLKKLTPLIAAEVFYHANYGFRFIDQLRFFVGADYELNKRWKLGLQWVRTQQIQVNNPVTSDIAYVGLTYDIQKGTKKKLETQIRHD
jgi:hypothetical protein